MPYGLLLSSLILRVPEPYEKLLAAHNSKKKKQPREVVGDFLGGADAKEYGPRLPEEVFACFNSIIQGDHLGVEIATQSHRNMLRGRGLLCEKEELTSNLPFGGRSCLQGLIIDDFFSVSIEDDTDSKQVPLAEKRLRVAQQAYKEEGLLGSEEKNVISEECSKVAGAELDGSAFTRKLGLCTLAAPASKRLGLSFLSLQLASLRATTDSLHACLLGGWTSCLMYRRALMSILDRVHSFADMSLVDQNNPKVLKMPRLVAQEFVLLGILAPFMCADLAAPISTSVYASDASDLKGAIVKSDVGEDLARGLWRTGRKKGGYTRLLSREQALLAKIDTQWEEDVPVEKTEHPSKPLAMRYHFIEICGGAGRSQSMLTKKASSLGRS